VYWKNKLRIQNFKKIEFLLKKLIPKKYQFKKRIERSIKNLDEPEIDIIKNLILTGTDAIDVGVYRGVHSFEMSKYSSNVHSFEPNPIIYNDLVDTLPLIKKNIKLYNFALSDKNGEVKIRIPIRDKNANKKNYEEYFKMGLATIHENNNFDNFEEFTVISKKIDDINFENKISFIKIDVEGHELEVIKGGLNLINKFKPSLMVEIEEKHSKKPILETINFISNIGYKVFCLKDKELVNIEMIDNLRIFNNFIFTYKKN
tara:strand:+ start:127 stop:903 length:777 start_codon:yes stop_codon:yes gene_type:complete